METTTPAAVDPPANVLVVQSNRRVEDGCLGLYHDEGGTATLTVTFEDGPIEHPYPTTEETLGFLLIGDVLTDSDDGFDVAKPVMSHSIPDPTDLSAIGVAISRFCSHWPDDDERITICFDSLDALLGHTDPKTVFQFTHVLLHRLTSVDAYAHFHFDPTHYEDRVVQTFGTVFDAVVTDDETRDAFSEATDDEVADLLAEWDDESAIDPDSDPEPVTEATDEELANLLGE